MEWQEFGVVVERLRYRNADHGGSVLHGTFPYFNGALHESLAQGKE